MSSFFKGQSTPRPYRPRPNFIFHHDDSGNKSILNEESIGRVACGPNKCEVWFKDLTVLNSLSVDPISGSVSSSFSCTHPQCVSDWTNYIGSFNTPTTQ